MVELFAALGFAEGPRRRSEHRSRPSPGRELLTPAELNGPHGPEPLGRDSHPLRDITASMVFFSKRQSRFFPVAPFPRDIERRRGQSDRRRWPPSWADHPRKKGSGDRDLPRVKFTTHPRAVRPTIGSNIGIGLAGVSSDGTTTSLRGIPREGYSDEPPSNWTSHSHGIQLYESAPRRMVNPAPLDRAGEAGFAGWHRPSRRRQ